MYDELEKSPLNFAEGEEEGEPAGAPASEEEEDWDDEEGEETGTPPAEKDDEVI